jgi:hypothetical protein
MEIRCEGGAATVETMVPEDIRVSGGSVKRSGIFG